MARETGKQRSQRIEIDYYRKTGGLHRLKIACVIAALFVSATYAVYVLAAGGQSHTSTGPLSRAHASFENDCHQCHTDFSPIDSRGAKLNLNFVGIDSEKSIAQIERSCQKCHQVGNHYRDKMHADWQLTDQNCAGCHADHKGRDFDLNLIAASQCNSCHALLSEGCKGTPTVRENVVAFTKDLHGDFKSLAKDHRGTIKFDHRQHMMAGQIYEGQKGAFTIAMLDPTARSRYLKPGQTDESPVTLDCSSCHQFAGVPDRSKTMTADAELGRYIQPIAFDDHCAACHGMNPGIATPETTPLPHAVTWSRIELLLTATINGARASGIARLPRDDHQATPQPGAGLGRSADNGDPVDSAGSVQAALQVVKKQCSKCHDDEATADTAIQDALSGIAAPMIPPRWFVHGLYDHAVHREISCSYCHAGAYPNGEEPGLATRQETEKRVMIAGIDSCTGCHRDAETAAPDSLTSATALLGSQTTWASDNCTTCHRYHTAVTHQPTTSPLSAETTE